LPIKRFFIDGSGGYLFLQLFFNPALCFVGLTMRAVAMPAGMHHQYFMFAAFIAAFHQHFGALFAAAA